MDGITGAMARVAELQSRLGSLAPRAAQPGFNGLLAQQQPAQPAPRQEQAPTAAWSMAVRPVLAGTAAPGPLSTGPAAAVGRNGRLPDSALVEVAPGERLQPAAAEAFLALRDAAREAGVALPVNDSYRSYQEQVDVAARKGLYSEGGLAARPGTSSHGLGLSVDLQLDAQAQSWMRANASRFGFDEDVPREPWHWTYTR